MADLTSPYPYFGGKSLVVPDVWAAVGDVPVYIEPFLGSAAMLLGRPGWHPEASWIETVNDLHGMISNFWRALQAEPEVVARHADWPVLENDLHARHAWLVGRKDSLQARLEGDPGYYDAQVAGWWVWGMACWIGGGFCAGQGPWQVDGAGRLVHLSGTGHGVQRKRVHLSGTGHGVQRQRVHLGDAWQGVEAWMQALAARFRRVRVCCGDWTRICGGDSGDALQHLVQRDLCGVFLDPPYGVVDRSDCYAHEDREVSAAVRAWAIRHGADPRFRIVLCGYEGEHAMPPSWRCLEGRTRIGMSGLAKDTDQGRLNRRRERLWLSPHCLSDSAHARQPTLLSATP